MKRYLNEVEKQNIKAELVETLQQIKRDIEYELETLRVEQKGETIIWLNGKVGEAKEVKKCL